MAKTTFLSIPEGLEEKYFFGLQSGDRYITPKIRLKSIIQSRQKIENLLGKSYLPQCSALWKTLTQGQKDDWKDVDFHTHKHGWRTFLGDQCKMFKYGIPGTATPNEYHQGLVGEIYLEAPASEIQLTQPHPYSYYISRKKTGAKNTYELKEINEYFSLPLKIGLSFKTNLESVGTDPRVDFYAKIRHLYQGNNLLTDLKISLPLVQSWKREDATQTTLIGQAISYNLYFYLKDVQGELFFDNVEATHNSQNWARDIFCDKIEKAFTRGFYQVPQNWAPIIISEGADYQSIYPS